jgi:hypothetical protein
MHINHEGDICMGDILGKIGIGIVRDTGLGTTATAQHLKKTSPHGIQNPE